MRIEDIPDKEFYAEYRRREDIKAKNKEALEKDMEEHRIFWLKSHGGTDGNDQCCDNYCRINCYGCDGFGESYDYDPNWKNKINGSPKYTAKPTTKMSKRDAIIAKANQVCLQKQIVPSNKKNNNCPYSSNNNTTSSAWCDRDTEPPDWLTDAYEQ
jgi:hypothetical protein